MNGRNLSYLLIAVFFLSNGGVCWACNQPPVAEICRDETPWTIYASVNSQITLDGSDSYDPDGDIEEYRWDISRKSGWQWLQECVIYTEDDVSSYTFSTPGTYLVELTVTDDDYAESTSSPSSDVYVVQVTVTDCDASLAHGSSTPADIAYTIDPSDPTFRRIVRLIVKNSSGTAVRTDILDDDFGSQTTAWDGKNDSGQWVSPGDYTVYIEAELGYSGVKLSDSASIELYQISVSIDSPSFPAYVRTTQALSLDSSYTGQGGGSYHWTKVSGPGTVTFSPSAYTADPSFSANQAGTYRVKVEYTEGGTTVDDTSGYIYVTDVDVEIDSPSSSPAYVAQGSTLPLACTSEGLGGGSYHWSKVSGPGTVTFSPSAYAEDPSFSAGTTGNYTVKVAYTEAGITADDTTGTITVFNVGITAPSFPTYAAAGSPLQLNSTPSDGGGTYTWSKVFGPGTVTFSPSASAEDPTFAASVPGNYAVRLVYAHGAASYTVTSGTIAVTGIAINSSPADLAYGSTSGAAINYTITPSDATFPRTVRLIVKNAGGSTIRTAILDDAFGSQTAVWDGKNDAAEWAPAGNYTMTIEVELGATGKTVVDSCVIEVYETFVGIDAPSSPMHIRTTETVHLLASRTGRETGSFAWRKLSGPGNVTFTPDENRPDPDFSADQEGDYVLGVDYTEDDATVTSAPSEVITQTTVGVDIDVPAPGTQICVAVGSGFPVACTTYGLGGGQVVWSPEDWFYSPWVEDTGAIAPMQPGNYTVSVQYIEAGITASDTSGTITVAGVAVNEGASTKYIGYQQTSASIYYTINAPESTPLNCDWHAELFITDGSHTRSIPLNIDNDDLNTELLVVWDGKTDSDSWAPAGTYTAMVQLYLPNPTALPPYHETMALDWCDIVVYEMNVDMVSPNDAEEENPGCFIAVNDDDDDHDGIIDLDDPVPYDEDDCRRLEGTEWVWSHWTYESGAGHIKVEISDPSKLGLYEGDTLRNPSVTWDMSDSGQAANFAAAPSGWSLEGRAGSETLRDVSMILSYSRPLGNLIHYDTVNFTVVKVDLDIDSDNDGTLERDGEEEKFEETHATYMPSIPGKYIGVNDNDEDDDGIPDYADGFDWDGSAGNDDDNSGGSEALTPLVLELDKATIANGKVRFTYDASNPADLGRAGTPPDYTYTPASGKLRIWTQDGNQSREKASANATPAGDYVAPGVYTPAQLGFSSEVTVKTFYVEAVDHSNAQADLSILVEIDPDGDAEGAGFDFRDAVHITAIQVDCDVDTDNEDAFNNPDRSLIEDHYEDKSNDAQGNRPGKYVEVNLDDDDADGIPDFADGFDRYSDGPGNADNSCNDEEFTPLIVELAAPIDLDTADIKISYNASDPSGDLRTGASALYTYAAPPSGGLRIWTKNGSSVRNKASAKALSPGDYVEPGIYDADKLGFEGPTRVVTLYVEGILSQTTQISNDGRIVVEVDPDGSEGSAEWVAVDRVRTMLVKSDVDIDTDNNDSIEDCDDPVEDKSPGAILPIDLEGDASGQDIRKEMKLKIEPPVYGGQVILDADAGVKIWTDATGGTEVSLPRTYNADSVPTSLWLDGVTKGSQADITLAYEDKNSLKVADDKIKAFVIETVSRAPHEMDQAYVWASLPSLGTGDGAAFETEVDRQGFDTDWYEDSDDWNNQNFGTCTLANYKNMCNCGALTVISHGGRGIHYAVYASTQAACDTWRGSETGMTTVSWENPPGSGVYIYAVAVSSGWLASNWAGTLNTNEATTLWSICYSANSTTGAAVKEAAGGRWRVGYCCVTSESEASAVNTLFLQRMNGTQSSGDYRTAGKAWDTDEDGVGGDGYTPRGCLHYPSCTPGGCPMYNGEGGHDYNVKMDGNNWTTLCPAPIYDSDGPVWPDSDPGSRYGWGCIVFDTYMDDGIGADTALLLDSGGPIYDRNWRGDASHGRFILGFDYDKTSGTSTTMRAEADNCKNAPAGEGREMDGNRQADNEDDKSWTY